MNRAPDRAFDRQHTNIFETGLADLPNEILGTVKIGGCEVGGIVGRISMLAGRKIACDDVPESRIFEISSEKTIAQRSEAGNRSGKNNAARLEDTIGFAKCRKAIRVLYKMIKRAEQENRICNAGGKIQLTCVTRGNRR